tara:strand:+ start:2117 stop:2440 length:324 start_codon:yes stop_codon:yes gene_type:complete
MRDNAESLVAGGGQIESAFEAHVMNWLLSFVGGLLHQGSQQVIRDNHHGERFVRHFRKAVFRDKRFLGTDPRRFRSAIVPGQGILTESFQGRPWARMWSSIRASGRK